MDGPFVALAMYTRLPEALNARPAAAPPGFPATDPGRSGYGAWKRNARAVPKKGSATSRSWPCTGKAMLLTCPETEIGDPGAGVRSTFGNWIRSMAICDWLPTAR